MKIGIMISIAVLTAMIGLAAADIKPTGAVMGVSQSGSDTLFPTSDVYIKAVNLQPNMVFSWKIYDMNAAGCSVIQGIGCGTLVNSGNSGSSTTDSNGDIGPNSGPPFFPTGFSIPNGDFAGHPYKLVVYVGSTTPANAFYTKVDSLAPVPELSPIILVSAGLLGMVLVLRKYKRN